MQPAEGEGPPRLGAEIGEADDGADDDDEHDGEDEAEHDGVAQIRENGGHMNSPFKDRGGRPRGAGGIFDAGKLGFAPGFVKPGTGAWPA